AVDGPIGSDARLVAGHLHGRLLHADARGLVEVVGQLGVGPVGPVEPLLGRPLDPPAATAGRGRRSAWASPPRFTGAQAVEAALQVGVEPALDGARGDAQVLGDGSV